MNNHDTKNVRWLASAYEDAQAIMDYIAADNPVAAERWIEIIRQKAAALGDAPFMGAPVERHRQARFVTYGQYVIYYTVHSDEVVIRAVVHGARRFRRKWLQREE